MLTLLGCRDKPNEEEEARKEVLTKQCTYKMVQAAVPNFLAASAAVFIFSLIEYIAEESEGDRNTLKLMLALIASLIFYSLGKCVTWMLIHYEQLALQATTEGRTLPLCRIFSWLMREKLIGVVKRFLAEFTGFLLKDFLTLLVLNLVFDEHGGFGPAFGVWVLFICIYIVWVRVGALIAQKMKLPALVQEELLDFDADSFSLSIAYVLTVLLSLGSAGAGFTYISPASYLYSYEESYSEDESFGSNQYAFLYVWVSTVFIGALLLIEDKLGVKYRAMERQESVDVVEKNVVDNSSIAFRHNVYGSFCGLAWFLLIVDNIAHIVGDTTLDNFIGVAVCAILLSWRGPSIFAARILVVEKQKKAVAARANREAREAENVDQAAPQGGCWATMMEWYSHWSAFNMHLNMHQRTVSLVALRLAVGWVWEVVVDLIFLLLSGVDETKGVQAAASCGAMFAAFIVSCPVLWCFRDWDEQEAGENAAADVQPVANPLAAEMNPLP